MQGEHTVLDDAGYVARTNWPLYAVLAVLIGIYLGVNQMIDNSHLPPWKPFLWEMSSAIIVVASIPLIVRFERRFRLDARTWGRTLLAHAGGALVFSAVPSLEMNSWRWRS